MAGVANVVLRAAGGTSPKPAADPISRWELDETSSAEGVFEDRGPAHVLMVLSGLWTDLTTGSLVEDGGGTSAYTDGSAYATMPANAAAHNLAALTVSFYYQRASAGAKHILLAGGDGSEVGDFSIEVLANGMLRGWHTGQDSTLRFFESTSGITGTNLQVGVAHRIDLSLGPQGVRIYLDGSELTAAAIPENTNGWNNGRVKYLGRWVDGILAPAVGVFDRLRIWNRQLSAQEIQALEPAQSIELAEQEPVENLPAAPAANAYWVDPINGNDGATPAQARSGTTAPSASPWRSLSRAITQWNAGNLSASASGDVEIILRGGLSYERGNNLTITRDGTAGSHLVIKGYRDDIEAGTRGGTGKFTGAKGWFVLRGNIEALENGGWELWDAGRSIYRPTGTFSLAQEPHACWLGPTTHNLRLNAARNLNDLDTANETGVTSNPVYSAPGLVQHSDNRIYVRMEPNQWTNFFDDYFADQYYPNGTVPTWGLDPSGEPLAIWDHTQGLILDDTSWIDLAFFKAEYWQRGIRFLGDVLDCTLDFVHVKGGAFCIDAGDAREVANISITHCDCIQNIAPWHGWAWIKENGKGIQGPLQGRGVLISPVEAHHITIKHCRIIRPFDGGGADSGNNDIAPHDIIFENNQIVWARDDAFAFSSSIYNSRFAFNYLELCPAGLGTVGRPGASGPSQNLSPGTCFVGFNVCDLRRPYLRGRPGDPSGEFNNSGTSALAENFGLQWFRMDPTHSIDNDEVREWKYYHNLILAGKNESNVGVWSWSAGIKNVNLQEERYNNVIINVENAEYHGRGKTQYIEQDYNMYYGDPAGSFSENKVAVNPSGGGNPHYATWAAFKASGGNYNQTKHSNGDGPGSPDGWEANGKEGQDPDFVNGKWGTLIAGDLSTYFPENGGNMTGAVSLTGTGWPDTSAAQSYLGPYAPGDDVTKIGPEQGLWKD